MADKGWNPIYDEGFKLKSSKAIYSRIKVLITMPDFLEAVKTDKDLYATFYVGIDERAGAHPGAQIEAGISFSYKKPGWNWNAYIHYGDGEVGEVVNSHIMQNLKWQNVSLDLRLANGQAILETSVNKQPLKAPTTMKVGAVKMIVAVHDYADWSKRAVRFGWMEMRYIDFSTPKIDDPKVEQAEKTKERHNNAPVFNQEPKDIKWMLGKMTSDRIRAMVHNPRLVLDDD